jgi:hypothetical protein
MATNCLHELDRRLNRGAHSEPLLLWSGYPDRASLGDRPLVVLTAGRYWAPGGFEKEAAEYHEIWVHQLQASLVHLSTRGRQVIVDAHHDMVESPDSIVTAVRQVVDEVRSKKITDHCSSLVQVFNHQPQRPAFYHDRIRCCGSRMTEVNCR